MRLPAIALGSIVVLSPALARVYEQPKASIEAVFPDSEVQRRPVYLSKEEQKQLSGELGRELKSRFFTFYEARKGGKLQGYGTFHTEVVRTKEQTLFVAVDAQYRVKDVRLISFYEPDEYRPPDRWLKILKGKNLSDSIQPGKDLPAMSGATLTSRSTSQTTRMVLAIARLKL
jgi:hypothetical protein